MTRSNRSCKKWQQEKQPKYLTPFQKLHKITQASHKIKRMNLHLTSLKETMARFSSNLLLEVTAILEVQLEKKE